MADENIEGLSIKERASERALIERFHVSGLYGYRSIGLVSPYSATVLIARNGAGKTTLIGALDAFLKRQFLRLRNLDFKAIECKFYNENNITLHREEIVSFVKINTESKSEIYRFSDLINTKPLTLLKFIWEDYSDLKGDYRVLSSDPVYAAIEKYANYNSRDVRRICDELKKKASLSDNLEESMRILDRALENIEVVYLPTYRRIELPISQDLKDSSSARQRSRAFKAAPESLFNLDIQFGLSDTAQRLREMNTEIVYRSSIGYRQISAEIVNELIDGALEDGQRDLSKIPKKDDLRLFFSRLKERGRVAIGPFMDDISEPNIDKIYGENEIPANSSKFLQYFLGKLSEIINITKDVEGRVDEFVRCCNRYLSSQEGDINLSRSRLGADDKVLVVNRLDFDVRAESASGGRVISLDALSSGEKQIVSLFARLCLYPMKKIVLIDEPELSLSLDWQREILVDVMRQKTCRQLIAITHSPFVFENDLEPYAKSLEMAVDLDAVTEDDEDIDLGLDG